jgi:hypothetical protein
MTHFLLPNRLFTALTAVTFAGGTLAASAAPVELWSEDWEGDISQWTLTEDDGTEIGVVSTTAFGDGTTSTNALRFGDDLAGSADGTVFPNGWATASRSIPAWTERVSVAFDIVFPEVADDGTLDDSHPSVELLTAEGDRVALMLFVSSDRVYLYDGTGSFNTASGVYQELDEVNNMTLTYVADNGSGQGEILMTNSNADEGANPFILETTANLDVSTLLFTGGNADRREWVDQDAYIDNILVSTVPEPATMALLAAGAGLVLARRRR